MQSYIVDDLYNFPPVNVLTIYNSIWNMTGFQNIQHMQPQSHIQKHHRLNSMHKIL